MWRGLYRDGGVTRELFQDGGVARWGGGYS